MTLKNIEMYFASPNLLVRSLLLCLFFSCISLVRGQSNPKFKVIAFYSASFDVAHISFAHEANRWFPKMAEEYGFQYDSTKNWNNLNEAFLSQYQVVLFLDDQPPAGQRMEFENYMKKGGAWWGFHVCAFNTNPADWDWYHNQLLGTGAFKSNTWGPTSAVFKVEEQTHPATVHLPEKFTSAVSEWYSWTNDLRTNPDIKILCSIDSSSFPLGTDPNQSWYSGYYPIVWTNTNYHMLYANFGHNDIDYVQNNADKSLTFSNDTQNKMIIDGLFWLAGLNMPDPRVTKMSITSPLNGAVFEDPASITIDVNASDSDGVAKVEFFNGDTKLGEDSSSPYSFTWENMGLGNFNIVATATDSLGNIASSSVLVSVEGKGAYNNSPANIPGRIEVENFDYGGQDVGYNDGDVANNGNQYRTNEGVDIETCSDEGGGFDVGYTSSGEWLKYTVNVNSVGNYTIDLRLASTSSGKKLHIELDGEDISGPIEVPNTGGWQSWKTASVNVEILEIGQKVLKIVMDTDGFNINYINFSQPLGNDESVESKIYVYPNPSNGIVRIKPFQDELNANVLIKDHIGRVVKVIRGLNLNTQLEAFIDFSGLPKGVYFIKLGKAQTAPKKVIIE